MEHLRTLILGRWVLLPPALGVRGQPLGQGRTQQGLEWVGRGAQGWGSQLSLPGWDYAVSNWD